MMSAGELNRRITFERKVSVTGFGRAGQESWVPVATVWAQVRDVIRGERVSEGLEMANRPARIRMRYRAGITSAMRIRHGDRIMQITAGPAEIGPQPRRWMELMAESYSTAGGAA